MLYREIIAVCSQIHIKHINTAVWAERGIFNVKSGDAQSKHWAGQWTENLCWHEQHGGKRPLADLCRQYRARRH